MSESKHGSKSKQKQASWTKTIAFGISMIALWSVLYYEITIYFRDQCIDDCMEGVTMSKMSIKDNVTCQVACSTRGTTYLEATCPQPVQLPSNYIVGVAPSD
jgi:hypothetical protein